jgi:hypothetical protein
MLAEWSRGTCWWKKMLALVVARAEMDQEAGKYLSEAAMVSLVADFLLVN